MGLLFYKQTEKKQRLQALPDLRSGRVGGSQILCTLKLSKKDEDGLNTSWSLV
jgi:hypothetical protein